MWNEQGITICERCGQPVKGCAVYKLTTVGHSDKYWHKECFDHQEQMIAEHSIRQGVAQCNAHFVLTQYATETRA